MMAVAHAKLDPLTKASVTVAWVILLNKPFYPLYIWYLVGNGVTASLGTLAAAPLFLAIPFIALRSPLSARIALPLVGTFDTLFETKLFGQHSGTELFLAACLMLVAVSFREDEQWWQRGMAVLVFAAFVFSRGLIGAPLHVWTQTDLAILLNLNAFAVASLMAFVTLRYAGTSRQSRLYSAVPEHPTPGRYS
ncbi:hypothetical protein [Rhizobium leguminosarum]|uniref:hypothetical protein n=1 Tax=Rhizobium leguminosarum TaxID=384 RepID=UPI0013BB35CC|nr:hypothetical protein [Rhizobium leguminosarum]NEH41961.1 hypothetical protein [Rhizobium leguminosarum]NKL53601.1 hypothetical protein [Rhizobium leguminosarum bv. viciae]